MSFPFHLPFAFATFARSPCFQYKNVLRIVGVRTDMPSSLSESSHQILLIAQSFSLNESSSSENSPCTHATATFSRSPLFQRVSERERDEKFCCVSGGRKNLFSLSITFSTFHSKLSEKFSSFFSTIKCKKFSCSINISLSKKKGRKKKRRRKFIPFGARNRDGR